MITVTLTAEQLAELRAFWIYDEYSAGPPVVARSMFNRRYTEQFFTDAELQLIARRVYRRWGEVLAEAGPLGELTALGTSTGDAIGAGPTGSAVVLSQAATADDAQPVIVYGSAGAGAPYTLEYEIVSLSKDAAVTTDRDDWQQILGAEALDEISADVTVTPSAGGSALLTLTAAAPSAGIWELDEDQGQQALGADLWLAVDHPRAGYTLGLIGSAGDGSELGKLITLNAHTPTGVPRDLQELRLVLLGTVPVTTAATLYTQDQGAHEAHDMVYRAIQTEAFRAYLGSDRYARALEDQAASVRQGWETRITNNLKTLRSLNEGRAGSVAILR